MKLPTKNTLRKAFMAVAASSTLALTGCMTMMPATTYDANGLPQARPLPADIYIRPIAPIPYVTVYGPTYNYHYAPHEHRDHRRDERHHRDYRWHR